MHIKAQGNSGKTNICSLKTNTCSAVHETITNMSDSCIICFPTAESLLCQEHMWWFVKVNI